jgi:N-acetylglucosaminyldiphosphoundecaprenol N-acetyl-beta-D-mannosaminyltransferase
MSRVSLDQSQQQVANRPAPAQQSSGVVERDSPPLVPDRHAPAHREFLGMPFGMLELDQAVDLIGEQCDGPYCYVVTPNVAHVVKAHEEPDLLPLYAGAWLSLCDSQIIRALASLSGIKLPLVTGSDLVAALLRQHDARSAGKPSKLFLIVGPDAAVRTILRERYGNLAIEVMPAPANLNQRPDLRRQLARACAERPWDFLLLCVGSPAQEWVAHLIAELGRSRGVALCVGASVDFLTGARARAPRWLQRLGLEWAYRLLHEPRRLWRRYLVEGPRIFRIYLAKR